MGKADLHLHSARSDGMAVAVEMVRYAEGETDLDVIAIADHDQVAGALEAVEWCAGRPGGRLQAIVGTEITTAWGRHVLALFFRQPFPTRPFPRFRSLAWTVATVREAGGLVAVPHPLRSLVPSVGARSLAALLADDSASGVEAVEVCSGIIGGRLAEARMRRLNEAIWRLAALGNSDAHHLAHIGRAFTAFRGRTPADLERAILERTTEACWGASVRVPLTHHVRQGWLSLVVKPAREFRGALRS